MEQRTSPMEQHLHQEGQDYYRTLKHYIPLCYSGYGVPFFLVNDTYYKSLPCIICIDVIFALGIALAIISAKNSNKMEFQYMMVKLYSLTFVLINLSYFFTVAMNPGIKSEKDTPEMEEDGEMRYCKICMKKKVDMFHCNQCEVCVQDIDHHCGFFGRCIAGKQKFAFYAFILFMFCGFIVFFVGLTSVLN